MARWVWICEASNNASNWKDTASCGAKSRKPVATAALAEQGLERHQKNCWFGSYKLWPPATIKNIGRKKWLR